MTIERWRQIEDIFHEVLARPAGERPAALRAACGSDEELRREVAELVSNHLTAEPDLITLSVETLLCAALEQSALVPGEQIGAYRIDRPIGAGGMGQVYEAWDARLGRKVALKILSPVFVTDAAMAARFEREARLLSSLNHPNIVTVHDTGEWHGQRYLVTEFVDGITLRERLVKEPHLDSDEIAGLMRQIASGLGAAHRAGIIHRDIKPENIMIRSDGIVRLLDFGLAKLSNAAGDTHKTGFLIGTPAYMSPEQLRGEPLDARTDIWSLGAVLYEIAAGTRAPAYPPPPLPGRMSRFNSAIRLALQPDRNLRPSDVDEIVNAFSMRRKAPAVAVLVALITVFAVAGVWSWRASRAPGKLEVSKILPLTRTGKTAYAAVSPNGQFVAYTMPEKGGVAVWARQIAETRDLRLAGPLRSVVGLTFSPSGDYIYFPAYGADRASTVYRVPVTGGDLRPVVPGADTAVAVSPDDRQVAFIRDAKGHSSLIAAAVDGSGERTLATRADPNRFRITAPAWSPDERHIAAATFETVGGQKKVVIRAYDMSGNAGPVLGPAWADIDRIAWAPDGVSLFVTGRVDPDNSQVFRVMYPGGETYRITSDVSSYFDIGIQADGLTLSAVRSLPISYITAGNPPKRITSGSAHYTSLSPDRDGLLAISDASGSSEIWRLPANGLERRLTSDGIAKRDVDACPGGKHIVYSSARLGGWSIWRVDADGRNPVALTQGNCCDQKPRCSPDGSTVLFQSNRSGRLTAWSVPVQGGLAKQLVEEVCISPVWSPDGASFACHYLGPETSRKWAVAIFPAAGQTPSQIVEAIGRDSILRWDPSGRALLYTLNDGSVSNVWRLPIGGNSSEQITTFAEDRMFEFAPAPQGGFVFLRGVPGDDAVRILLQPHR